MTVRTVSIAWLLCMAAAAAAGLMPPHITGSDPHDGGVLHGNTLVLHGYSLAHGGDVQVLRYNDFGPQVAASRLLGMEWWACAAACSSAKTDDEFDIRVAVYRDVPKSIVAKRSGSVKERSDHRTVSYDDAVV